MGHKNKPAFLRGVSPKQGADPLLHKNSARRMDTMKSRYSLRPAFLMSFEATMALIEDPMITAQMLLDAFEFNYKTHIRNRDMPPFSEQSLQKVNHLKRQYNQYPQRAQTKDTQDKFDELLDICAAFELYLSLDMDFLNALDTRLEELYREERKD